MLSVTIQLTVVITNPKIVAGLLNIFVAKFRVKYSNMCSSEMVEHNMLC